MFVSQPLKQDNKTLTMLVTKPQLRTCMALRWASIILAIFVYWWKVCKSHRSSPCFFFFFFNVPPCTRSVSRITAIKATQCVGTSQNVGMLGHCDLYFDCWGTMLYSHKYEIGQSDSMHHNVSSSSTCTCSWCRELYRIPQFVLLNVGINFLSKSHHFV